MQLALRNCEPPCKILKGGLMHAMTCLHRDLPIIINLYHHNIPRIRHRMRRHIAIHTNRDRHGRRDTILRL